MARKPTALALAALVAALSASPARAEQSCISNWSLAAPLVAREGLVSVERLAELARGHLAGEIVKTDLCESRQGWSYRLVVREGKGRLRSLSVDARNPFGR